MKDQTAKSDTVKKVIYYSLTDIEFENVLNSLSVASEMSCLSGIDQETLAFA